MFSRRTMAALGAVGLVAGTLGFFGVKDLRFWAWRSDFREIAKDFYGPRVSQAARRLEVAHAELTACRKTGESCWRQAREVSDREQKHAEAVDALRRLGE